MHKKILFISFWGAIWGTTPLYAMAQVIEGGAGSGLPVLINSIYQGSLFIGTALLGLMIFYGSLRLIASRGNPSSIQAAKQTVIDAVLGFLLLLLVARLSIVFGLAVEPVTPQPPAPITPPQQIPAPQAPQAPQSSTNNLYFKNHSLTYSFRNTGSMTIGTPNIKLTANSTDQFYTLRNPSSPDIILNNPNTLSSGTLYFTFSQENPPAFTDPNPFVKLSITSNPTSEYMISGWELWDQYTHDTKTCSIIKDQPGWKIVMNPKESFPVNIADIDICKSEMASLIVEFGPAKRYHLTIFVEPILSPEITLFIPGQPSTKQVETPIIGLHQEILFSANEIPVIITIDDANDATMNINSADATSISLNKSMYIFRKAIERDGDTLSAIVITDPTKILGEHTKSYAITLLGTIQQLNVVRPTTIKIQPTGVPHGSTLQTDCPFIPQNPATPITCQWEENKLPERIDIVITPPQHTVSFVFFPLNILGWMNIDDAQCSSITLFGQVDCVFTFFKNSRIEPWVFPVTLGGQQPGNAPSIQCTPQNPNDIAPLVNLINDPPGTNRWIYPPQNNNGHIQLGLLVTYSMTCIISLPTMPAI